MNDSPQLIELSRVLINIGLTYLSQLRCNNSLLIVKLEHKLFVFSGQFTESAKILG